MQYNSQRSLLIIPEYGRHVQELIIHAKTIADKNERQMFVEQVVELIMQMHPHNKNLDDYREKLWKHIFRIAEYELDVEVPKGVTLPSFEKDNKKPERLAYPVSEARFRHYGHNVQEMIKKAMAMEEGPVRAGFVATIGNYMKLAYRTWNKEVYISDEVIKSDLKSLSKGALSLDADTSLDSLSNSNRRKRRPNPPSSNNNYRNNSRGRRGGGRRK